MTKARDISSLIGAGGIIDNSKITLDAAEIPNLDAAKITTGELANARVADLPASKITSGTFADARIASSNVSQHATTFDDSKIQQDLMVLALQQATDANKSAYSLSNSFIEQFEDSSGIDVATNAIRDASEYVSSGSAAVGVTASTIFFVDGNNTAAPFTDLKNGMTGATNDISGTGGTPTYNTGNQKWSGYNVLDLNNGTINYGTQYTSYWNGTGDYTIEFWFKNKGTMSDRERYWCFGNDSTNGQMSYGVDYGSSADFNIFADTTDYNPAGTFNHTTTDTAWRHFRYVRSGSDGLLYFDGTKIATQSGGQQTATMNQKFRISGRPGSNNSGTEFFDAYFTDFLIHTSALSTGASYTLPTAKAAFSTISATGNFTSVSKTAPATVSKMGIVVLYKNNAGTATLNTDLVAQVSANNGTNFTTVTLTPRGTFSTGINIAVANNVTVTSGTSCKYKISFANQSAGTKETQVHGIGLLY
jgi:hypothetical protein